MEKPSLSSFGMIPRDMAFTHKKGRNHDKVGAVMGQAAPAHQNNLLVVRTQQHN